MVHTASEVHGIGADTTVRFTGRTIAHISVLTIALIGVHSAITHGDITAITTHGTMTHGTTALGMPEATGDGTIHGTITTTIADGTTRHTISNQEVRLNRDTMTGQTTDGMVCAPKPAAAQLIQVQ